MSDARPTAAEIVALLDLEPLPGEGGRYRQTYRSEETLRAGALPERYDADHPMGTAIYYLLTDDPDSFSALHRLPTDEIYHFYLGDPVELFLLRPDGGNDRIVLGPDLARGERVQFVVPRGVWQGSRLIAGGRYALLGTTMAPGFEFIDFEAGDVERLAARHPGRAEVIRALTRPS